MGAPTQAAGGYPLPSIVLSDLSALHTTLRYRLPMTTAFHSRAVLEEHLESAAWVFAFDPARGELAKENKAFLRDSAGVARCEHVKATPRDTWARVDDYLTLSLIGNDPVLEAALEASAEVARGNLERARLGKVVELRQGPVLKSLKQLVRKAEGPFDLIFIDADQKNYAAYFGWALKLSRPGTLIVVDNVVRGGAVSDGSSNDPSVVGARGLLEATRAARGSVSATAVQIPRLSDTTLPGPFEGYDATPHELYFMQRHLAPLAAMFGLQLRSRRDIDRVARVFLGEVGL